MEGIPDTQAKLGIMMKHSRPYHPPQTCGKDRALGPHPQALLSVILPYPTVPANGGHSRHRWETLVMDTFRSPDP
jgi:hypothetical protein